MSDLSPAAQAVLDALACIEIIADELEAQ